MEESSDGSRQTEESIKEILLRLFKDRYSQFCDDIPSSDLQSLAAKLYSADIISAKIREKTTVIEVVRAVEASLKANLNPSASDKNALQFVADMLVIFESDTTKKPIVQWYRDEAVSKGIALPPPSGKASNISGASSAALCSERRESRSLPAHIDLPNATKAYQASPPNTPPPFHSDNYHVSPQNSTNPSSPLLTSHFHRPAKIVGGSSLVMMGHGKTDSSAVFPFPPNHFTLSTRSTQDSGNATHNTSQRLSFSDHEEDTDRPHAVASEASGTISNEALQQYYQSDEQQHQKIGRLQRKIDRLEAFQKCNQVTNELYERQIGDLEDIVEKQQANHESRQISMLQKQEELRQQYAKLSVQYTNIKGKLERVKEDKESFKQRALEAEGRECGLRKQNKDLKDKLEKVLRRQEKQTEQAENSKVSGLISQDANTKLSVSDKENKP